MSDIPTLLPSGKTLLANAIAVSYADHGSVAMQIAAALVPYSTTAQMDTAIDAALVDYATTAAVTSAIAAALVGYATTSAVTSQIATALAAYSTTAETNTAISSAIATALADYSTTAETDSAISSAIATALEDYSTTAETDTAISSAIAAALVDYSTTTAMQIAIDNSIDAALTDYATVAQVGTLIGDALVDYSTTTEMNTALAGKLSLTGGTLTGTLTTADVVIQGDCTVMGETLQVDTVQQNTSYMSITQSAADGTTPALAITQGGTATGPIMTVTDSDTNIILQIEQDCTLDINGKFHVDGTTGNTRTEGDLVVNDLFTVGHTTGNVNTDGSVDAGGGIISGAQIRLHSVSSLPGSPSVGDSYFLTTDNTVRVWDGTAWITSSTGSSIVVTDPQSGDPVMYDSTLAQFVNGYTTDQPTLTYSTGFSSITFPALSSPYSYNGGTGSSMVIHLKVYSDVGLNTLVFEYNPGTGGQTATWTTELTDGVTYYAIGAQRATNRQNSWSPWSSTLTFTFQNDIIQQQLTTSLAAYQAASADTWVNVTSTEFNLVKTNVPGAAETGNTSQFTTGSHSAGNQASLTTTQTTFTNAQYPIALKVNATGYTGTNELRYGTSTTVVNGGNTLSFSSPAGQQTAGTTYYYVRKTPSTTVGGVGANYSSIFFSNTASSINSITNGSMQYYSGANPSPGTSWNTGSAELGLFTTATKNWP